MHTCPHCNHEVRINELPYQGFFNSFRKCPDCGGSFTVDTDTKYRQAICLFILLVALGFTLLLYFDGNGWLPPAVFSYVILALFTYWGNKRLYFVPYGSDQKSDDDQ